MMSETNENELEIQYILNDAEFMIETDEKAEVLEDVVYKDGNQAFVFNGQIFQGAESPTLVLQEGEDINQYLCNDDRGELLLANLENSINPAQETSQIIHFINEDGNVTEQTEYLLLNGEEVASLQNFPQFQITQLSETDSYFINKYDTNIDDNTQGEEAMELNASDWYQYAVIKDNNVDRYVSSPNTKEEFLVENKPPIDVSTITGKNLLTGQVVSLDNYMNKIQKKIKSIPKNSICLRKPKHNLNAFLNKKFDLGLSVGGRQLVGKIVYVGNKEAEDETLNENKKRIYSDHLVMPTKTNNDIKNQSLTNGLTVQKKLLSKKSDQFQRISKILSDLMTMESIKMQLFQKSIQIKIINKYCDLVKKINKNVSFISGYMECKMRKKDTNILEEWIFVPDTLRNEVINEKQSLKKYPNTIDLTIIMTYEKSKSFVQVVLDDSEKLVCDENLTNKQIIKCQLNDEEQPKTDYFIPENNLKNILDKFENKIDILRNSDNDGSLHFPEKDLQKISLEKYNCEICKKVCGNENKYNLHILTHKQSKQKKIQTSKYYSCDVCKRTFSRQSNLQRHIDIHKGAEQLYRCSICDCSYHYISSLTRHMVQNHVQIQRPEYQNVDAQMP